MKKFNHILLAGLTLVAAASCNKQLDTPAEPAGIPMTMTATIGGPQTKVEYTAEDNVLKGKWSANEQISVITLDENKNVKTIDTFSSSSDSEGQKTAEFYGSFTGSVNDEIRVIYPALTEFYLGGSNGKREMYGTKVIYTDHRLISGVEIGGKSASFDVSIFAQKANGDLSHIAEATILKGVGTVSEGTLTAELKPLTSVLRIDATIPEERLKVISHVPYDYYPFVMEIKVSSLKDSDNNYKNYNFTGSSFPIGDGGVSIPGIIHTEYSIASIDVGTRSGNSLTGLKLEQDKDTHFTAYVPFVPGDGACWGPSGGSKIKVEFNDGGYDREFNDTRTITLTQDTALKPGKMYRLRVDFN